MYYQYMHYASATHAVLSASAVGHLRSAATPPHYSCMVYCRNTPTALSLTGWTLLAAAAALVYFIPDDSTGLIAAQVAGASVLGGAAVAALVGAGFLSQLQKA